MALGRLGFACDVTRAHNGPGKGVRSMAMSKEAKMGIVGAIILGALVFAVLYAFGVTNPGGVAQPTSADVVERFKAEGLDVADHYPIGQDDQTPVPKTYREATRFTISSLGGGTGGGRVFVFDSPADMKPVEDYYEGFSGMLYSHVYTEGNVLLQINGELPKAKAEEYDRVLQEGA